MAALGADAAACAPEISAVAVASTPYVGKRIVLPKVKRAFWHGGQYLISVEQVVSCSATEIRDPQYMRLDDVLYLSWRWEGEEVGSGIKQCTRRVDVFVYALPYRDYRVKWKPRPDMVAGCE